MVIVVAPKGPDRATATAIKLNRNPPKMKAAERLSAADIIWAERTRR